jgi:hemerythrin
MDVITWTSQLSLGVHAIDSDHKLLISLINQFHEVVEAGEDQETIASVLDTLYKYTEYHFSREECLMAACGYPDLSQHKKTHQALKAKVMKIRDDYLADKTKVIGRDILDFMNSWLTDHIIGRDQLYRPSMEGKRDEVETANRAFVMEYKAP